MLLRREPTRPLVAALAIVAVALFGLSGLVGGMRANSAVGATGPTHGVQLSASDGQAQLAAARASLGQHDSARSPHHSTAAGVLSPGGYTWSNLSGIVSGAPAGQIAEALAWDPSDGYVLLFGGENLASFAQSITWSYANGTWTNLTSLVTGTPPPLVAPELAYDPSSHTLIEFGGQGITNVPSGATWSYHNRTWTNLSATVGTAPSPRDFQAMSTDSTDSQILLMGGTSNLGSSWLSDTWTFKAGHWTNVTSLAGSSFGHLLYPVGSDDPVDHGTFARGLYSSGGQLNTATLVFSSGSWRNVTSTLTQGPPGMFVGSAG
ncbi:MAG: hypothetical protein L3K07_04405, partial [Thermoplasmata archaeon]|nr:hypothetical protein [Thermoplasmata archaeon]